MDKGRSDHPNKKAVQNRLARAAGHLEKVRRMIDEERDCSEVLIQLSAVISDDGANPHAKMQALFDLIEYVTDTDKRAIVDRFGGDGAAPTDVLAYAAELSQKIISKN